MTAYLLNLVDLVFTLHALRHGAWELNPVMQDVPFMIGWKVGVVGTLCMCLEILATRYRSARWGMRACAAVYGAVNLWHIYNIFGR